MADRDNGHSELRPESFQPTPARPPRRKFSFSIVGAIAMVIVLAGGVVLWFLFTAKSVRFETNVPEVQIEVKGGYVLATGETFLMRQGTYFVEAKLEGYHDLSTQIDVLNEGDQTFSLDLVRLPGSIKFSSNPPGVEVTYSGQTLGVTPFEASIDAGEASFRFSASRYLDGELTLEVEGMQVQQAAHVDLQPDWANVTLETQPTEAEVWIDDELSTFLTPGPIEVPSGERKILVTKPGYSEWSDIIFVRAGETVTLDPVTLETMGGVVSINTIPSAASVIVNTEFRGTTPIKLSLDANTNYDVRFVLVGYETVSRRLNLSPGSVRNLELELEKTTGELVVMTRPEGAEILVDGSVAGISNATLTLHAVQHSIELRKEGYAGHKKDITIQPGFPHELRVELLTHEEARLEALKRVRTTADGQQIALMEPVPIRMGASRRQPGRRANEVFRSTDLKRLFYIGVHEVTNQKFKAFAPGHDSGSYQGVSLNKDNQPAVNVPWHEAGLYCNYLSDLEGLERFYRVQGAKVVGVNTNALGYRLPTEAEWSWVARHVEDSDQLLHFPWGDSLPPPNRHGNYADRAAQHVVGRIIFDYNDNHTVAAPVGTFSANSKGIYDIGGNVAEWIHDFYSVPTLDSVIPNQGPTEGEYHVIRGSSWLHGTIVDLRLSFRDYGIDGRNDVGFRIARYAE